MNEKLNNILSTLYNEPEKLHASCVENLVNKTLPDVNYGATYSTLGTLSNTNSYSVFDFTEFIKRQYLSVVEDYENKLEKDILFISEKLGKIEDFNVLYENIFNLAKNRTLENSSFIKNLKTILSKEENLKDVYSPIMASLILSNLEEKDNKTYTEIDKLATEFVIALSDAGNSKNIPQDVEELRNRSLNIIQTVFPDKVEDAKTLLNSYMIFSALALTTNSAVAIRCKVKYTEDLDYDGDAMMYYENCQAKPLISQKSTIKHRTNIIEALKGIDLIENSYIIEYAMREIEKIVRAGFNGFDCEIILISEIVFLTLCNELQVNVDDRVLFAFANPISEFANTINIKNLKLAVDISKKIATGILDGGVNDDGIGREDEYISKNL